MIYTLGQNGTGYIENNIIKPVAIVTGAGSKLGDDKVAKGRAKRKIISLTMALNLITIADKREAHDKKSSFWNTYHCQSKVYSYEGRLYGKYCKNRFCTLCCSIRKADLINKYLPVIKEWPQPQFVTLTIRACKATRLKVMLNGMIKAFRQINEKYRKRNQRNNGIRLIGVKSLECNFNPMKMTYNPHLHLIVASREIGEIIIKEWLAKWTSKFALRVAQDIRPINDLEGGLIEIIKYGSKIFTEPDVNSKSSSHNRSQIYAAALYNIFDAMKDLRIFERFGFDHPNPQKQIMGSKVVDNYYEWVFVPQYFDWLNTENELVLSGFAPKQELVNLLEHNINVELA